MFPIKDSLKPKTFPIATYSLIFINLTIFVIQLFFSNSELHAFYNLYGLTPIRIFQPEWGVIRGLPESSWFTLLTSMFIHGGWLHLIGNLWTLFLLGDDVEDKIGTLNFTLLYFAAGLFAGLTHLFLFSGSAIPTIGASGAIAGVMGAFLYLFPRSKIYFLVPIFFFIDIWAIPAFFYFPFWFISQLFSGVLSLAGGGFGGIAFWAHIGGFIAGLYFLHHLMKAQDSTKPVFEKVESDTDIFSNNPHVIFKINRPRKPRTQPVTIVLSENDFVKH
jgi:membrane associated rhomboid family serine protease